jgi:uncharacterized protein YyaL (SSP411 family)
MPANRLAREKSPYLLQHAHNPVDWYPWGEEAFEKAARENKPIFLSVGYSTCHWCHVMERESFENEDIASVLNRHFVAVKVDREERPDVDRLYMLFVQASTGSGGWPMSVWLTPERKPFFGGTYFPPDNRFGRPGFRAVLERLAQAWREDRARVEESGARVIEQLREYASLGGSHETAGPEVLDRAYQGFRRIFDARLGGFGGAPKFPRLSIHNFLLRHYAETKNEEALEMVLKTLREMEKGGMNDQIGGGFHRYSVDGHWFVPHFEKMLYDQAQLAVSYLEAFQITRDGQYAAAARDIFGYILRDMTDPGGGFYSAEDADSAADPSRPGEKGEGAFYIWTKREIEAALGSAALGSLDVALFCDRYGVREGGNVDEDPHGEFGGRNILFQAHTMEETASNAGTTADDVRQRLQRASARLLEIRSRRPRPLRDDKVLASWNGMMISAFAKGAQILGDETYARAARAAADFVRRHLWDDQRQILLRRHREGESAIDGFLDDYAYAGLALLDLYEATFESRDFTWAMRLAERAVELFEDTENGGFFSTAFSNAAEGALLRLKDDYDGAEPSGNSGVTLLLLRLSRMTDRADFRASAEGALRAFASRMREAGTGVPQMLVAHSFSLAKPREIVLAGPAGHPDMRAMLAAIRRRFLPNAVVMNSQESAHPMPAIGGGPTVYVCENFACRLPVTSVKALDDLLD